MVTKFVVPITIKLPLINAEPLNSKYPLFWINKLLPLFKVNDELFALIDALIVNTEETLSEPLIF